MMVLAEANCSLKHSLLTLAYRIAECFSLRLCAEYADNVMPYHTDDSITQDVQAEGERMQKYLKNGKAAKKDRGKQRKNKMC